MRSPLFSPFCSIKVVPVSGAQAPCFSREDGGGGKSCFGLVLAAPARALSQAPGGRPGFPAQLLRGLGAGVALPPAPLSPGILALAGPLGGVLSAPVLRVLEALPVSGEGSSVLTRFRGQASSSIFQSFIADLDDSIPPCQNGVEPLQPDTLAAPLHPQSLP